MAVKHELKVSYLSKTEKLKPNSKNTSKDLNFLKSWQEYLNA